MPIQTFSKLQQAFESGNSHYQYVYKTALPAPGTSGFFVDTNQTSGIPVYNAFAGSALTFTALNGQKNQGIFTGQKPNVSQKKYLSRFQALTTSTTNAIPAQLNLCDYLGFYPLIDCDNTDPQEMDNSNSLGRYADGKGVRIVLVATAPMTATASCTLVYTNQDGVSGRSVSFSVIPASSIGVCATGADPTLGGAGQATPFVNLAEGDTGVRAIESITFAAGAGGFIVACLVKPIAQLSILESLVPNEKTFGFEVQAPPEIHDDAYLNFLVQRGSTNSINLQAELIFLNI